METIGQSRVMQLSRLVLLVTGVTVGRVVVPRDPVDRILSHVLAPLANDRKFDLPGVSSSFRCQHTLTSNKIVRVPPPPPLPRLALPGLFISLPLPPPPPPATCCHLLPPATVCGNACLDTRRVCLFVCQLPTCVSRTHVNTRGPVT